MQLVLLPLANVQCSPGTREVCSCKLRVQTKIDKNVNLFVIDSNILEKSKYLAPPLKNWSANEIPHPRSNSRTEIIFWNLSFAVHNYCCLFPTRIYIYIQFIQTVMMNNFMLVCCKENCSALQLPWLGPIGHYTTFWVKSMNWWYLL